MIRHGMSVLLAAGLLSCQGSPGPERLPGARPRNLILILTDDHRYDAMGFLGHPELKTPHLDALARGGVYLKNACVTTSLCSPSRASILTGLFAHNHRVVDNNNPVPPETVYFPQYLKRAGYETAFVGKWHMGGERDDPQPGFDRWVSFKGQGTYYPGRNGLNVDGVRVAQKGYITDELTDYAIDWLSARKGDRPFFLYLSHKAVHGLFDPAERHKGRYKDAKLPVPPSAAPDPGRPMWVQNQRNSWHGVEFPYHGTSGVEEHYRRYLEAVLGVDESVGRVTAHLRERGWLDSTALLYMGDNGFGWGEHGLIDKRTAYEWSMRVPMLLHCPELFRGGSVVEEVVANIDVAPTFMELAGLKPPAGMDGRSFLRLAQGETASWREELLYEYYWEPNYPHTPTLHALRTKKYKYIRAHGLWDLDELYDLEQDPHETRNVAAQPAHAELLKRLNGRLFELLRESNGMSIPLYPDHGRRSNLRDAAGSPAAEFPRDFLKPR